MTEEEAAKLPNDTWHIHGEEGYLGALYVFHELHCLVSFASFVGFQITHVVPQDMIRQKLYESHYNFTFDDSIIRYCLSGLRQSVICSADTSVIVWQWSDTYNQVVERSDILHSCKNFTKIQEWVRSRYVDVNSLNFTSYH